MKSLWNCSLVFGDLVIPVKLYSATKQSHPEFEMVDSRDLGKIRFSRFNENTGEIVPNEFIGKAYNLDGTLVPVDPALVTSCIPEKSNRIGFNHFMPVSSIPAAYYENFYYVLPDISGTEGINSASSDYAIILHYLQSLNICGIAHSYFRNLSALFVLSAFEGKIILHKIRFQSGFVGLDAPVLPDVTGTDSDKESYILSFFNSHRTPFDPNLFKDSFSESLLSAIRQSNSQ